jgi:TRAP-type C4-dicarboxylate transport system permease small subunit
MRKFLYAIERPVARFEVFIAGLSIVLMAVIEMLNAFGRKLYMPFPCCLETAESLMITMVFLGIGYTAMIEEHTQVIILTRKFSIKAKRYIDAAAYLFGAVTFAFLAYGSWPSTWHSMMNLEIRIGVYNFPLWVFRLFFSLGLSLMTLHCVINIVRFISQARDPSWRGD